MSMKANIDDGTGNSEKDWEIFDVLCQNMDKVRAMSSSQIILTTPPSIIILT